MRKYGVQRFGTRQWMISDHDPSVAYLSKAAWDAGTTPGRSTRTRSAPSAAQAAVEPMLEMFREIEAVTTALEDHGMGLTFPHAGHDDAAVVPRADAERARRRPSGLPAGAGRGPQGADAFRGRKARLTSNTGPAGCSSPCEYFDAIEAVKKAATAEKAASDAKAEGRQSRVPGETGRGVEAGKGRPRRRLPSHRNLRRRRQEPSRPRRDRDDGRVCVPAAPAEGGTAAHECGGEDLSKIKLPIWL